MVLMMFSCLAALLHPVAALGQLQPNARLPRLDCQSRWLDADLQESLSEATIVFTVFFLVFVGGNLAKQVNRWTQKARVLPGRMGSTTCTPRSLRSEQHSN